MNALYNCCIIDPFLDVAKNLATHNNINPVYWIGDIDSTRDVNGMRTEVLRTFPEIEFQFFFDAWRGVFPNSVENVYRNQTFDVDFYVNNSTELLQALSMMDRLDYDHKSFCNMEREAFLINLAKHWEACIDLFHVDIVISAVNPHRVFDYVLYLICKRKNIKYISFQSTMATGRIFAVPFFSDIQAVENRFSHSYQLYLKDSSISYSALPEDILSSYEKLKRDYSVARPAYMKQHDVNDAKYSSMMNLFRRFMTGHKLFGKDSMFITGQTRTIYKNGKYCIQRSRFGLVEWYFHKRWALNYSKKLKQHYVGLVSMPEYDKPYVIFFLHYQPEATTSPNGGIFANQYLCIEMLLRYLPENYNIYIKEHPNQFMSHMQGFTKRTPYFYDELVSNPRVKLMPLEIDSFDLMKNAMAVSTITGTVGWEAVLHHKPVIIFGTIWYEKMKGVLKVVDNSSASKILSFIEQYSFDKHAILAYLHSVADNSIVAYHYRGYAKHLNISKQECADRITNEILKFV